MTAGYERRGSSGKTANALQIGHSSPVTIVAIGGCASVGKSTLARALGQRLNMPNVVHVDDLRGEHERRYGPSFIDVTPNVWARDARWLCDSLIASTRGLRPSVAAAIQDLLVSCGRGIIEGEGIEPAVVDHPDVRSVYVIEDNAEQLHATFAARLSAARFLALSVREQAGIVQMNRLYAIWLRSEAEGHGQPWIADRPWSTLADRAFAVIADTSP